MKKKKVKVGLRRRHAHPYLWWWRADFDKVFDNTICESFSFTTKQGAETAARRFWKQFDVEVEVVE